MTKDTLLSEIESEIYLATRHIQRGEQVTFYQGKLSGLTWARDMVRNLTTACTGLVGQPAPEADNYQAPLASGNVGQTAQQKDDYENER